MEEREIIDPGPEDETEEQEPTSDYGSSLGQSTFRSVTTTIREHVYEYGRRYHTYQRGRYPLPNDDGENDRETLKHIMLKEVVEGQLHLAPIGDHPRKIVDLGTGFGEWAVEVAEIFPGAQVLGIDLSPIQPTWVPPNVRFVVDDIEDEASWIHGDDIDYVHMRYLIGYLRDLPKLVENAVANMAPNGFLELQDLIYKIRCDDGTVPDDYPPAQFMAIVKRVFLEQYEFDVTLTETVPALLSSKGLINIHKKTFKLPIGGWPKDPTQNMLGRYMHPIVIDFFAAMVSRPFIEAELDKAEMDRLLQQCAVALADNQYHAYMIVQFVWAQKPGP